MTSPFANCPQLYDAHAISEALICMMHEQKTPAATMPNFSLIRENQTAMTAFRSILAAFAIGAFLQFPALALAGAKSATCVSKDGGLISNAGADGSQCDANGSSSGTASAKASGSGSRAQAFANGGGKATSVAKDGATVAVEADSGSVASTTATGAGTTSETFAANHSKAKATVLDGPPLTAHTESTGGGSATTKVSSGGKADVQSFAPCKATGVATNSGQASQIICEAAGGVASGTATNSGRAQAFSLAACTAKASARDPGSVASVECEVSGNTIVATASGGAMAGGIDDSDFLCQGPGKAKLTVNGKVICQFP